VVELHRFKLHRVLLRGVFYSQCLVHGIDYPCTVIASVDSPVSQHCLERLQSISINLKEHVPCPSLKVHFVIVEKFIVLDHRPIVVVYHLRDLGCRVRLVSVL
jgi:hypothetical protein